MSCRRLAIQTCGGSIINILSLCLYDLNLSSIVCLPVDYYCNVNPGEGQSFNPCNSMFTARSIVKFLMQRIYNYRIVN